MSEPTVANEPFHPSPPIRKRSSATADEGDTGDYCRICRGEATLDQPLFYPCKCSGSIKYVHQECLMEWLSHSQKKYCELCKTPFRFTKLYDQSMPATLPLPLFLRQVLIHGIKTTGRWLRYIVVTFVWSCWLPWSIRQVWRGLFWLADGSWMTVADLQRLVGNETPFRSNNTTSTLSTIPFVGGNGSALLVDPVGELLTLLSGAPLLKGLLRLVSHAPKQSLIPAALNVTVPHSLLASSSEQRSVLNRRPSFLSNVQSLNGLTKYALVNNTIIDVLEGQLVCLSIIAAFILIFLIREWVINQQPILNMPDPDQAEAAEVQPQPNEDARQAARRRRRVLRRPQDHVQGDNRAFEIAQRPRATPRPRRAATDNDLGEPQAQHFETRPRLIHHLSDPGRMVGSPEQDQDVEIIGPSMSNSEEVENFESPPLQRGMFDEVADIRRNIEERSYTSDSSTAEGEAQRIINGLDFQTTYLPLEQGENLIDFDASEPSDVNTTRFTFSSPTDLSTTSAQDALHQENHLPEVNNMIENDEMIPELPETDSDNAGIPTPTGTDSTTQEENEVADAEDVAEQLNAEPEVDAALLTLWDKVAFWLWDTDGIEPQGMATTNDELNTDGEVRPLEDAPNGNLPADAPAPEPAPPIPVPAPGHAHQPNIQFGIDLNDPNVIEEAEDLEGILELIGMEGPIAGMIQNIIFSVFLITLTLSASVWCPYIWGKIALLVVSNPVGVFIKAPVFLLSKCADVLVDLMLFIAGLTCFALTNLTRIIKLMVTLILPRLGHLIQVTTVENFAVGLSQNSGVRLERAFSGTVLGFRPDLPTFSMQSHHALFVFKKASSDLLSAVSSDIGDTFNTSATLWQSWGVLALPIVVGREILDSPRAATSVVINGIAWAKALSSDLKMPLLSDESHVDYSQMLMEWTTHDKIIAIVIGYVFFAFAGFAYLKAAHFVLGLKPDEKLEGVFADSLRQAGGVMKVIVIIGIEMIVFPLYCGLLLDCALLPLFKDATLYTRFSFLMSAPITASFVHWFIGTCYMFHFALFVSMCRKILRRGVLYFIRDPDDPTFHPVRDVLERPVTSQLGKIGFSALIYGGLIMFCLGGVVWTLSSITGLLPINWATNQPHLAIPIDVIFYNFMLPFVLKKAEPSRRISTAYEWWFRLCASKLRLSHFLLGEEKEEEMMPSTGLWSRLSASNRSEAKTSKKSDFKPDEANRQLDGTYVRAPASDSVRIPKGTRVFLEVNESNERKDGQPDLDKGMHGKTDDRFSKIYIPPHFRFRVATFIFLVWFFAASTGIVFTILPLLIGRLFFCLTAGASVVPNDLYAFTVGLHCLGAFLFAGMYYGIHQDDIKSRVLSVFTNARGALPWLYEWVRYISGLTYIGLVIGIVLPFSLSLLGEVYIHMPVYAYLASLNGSHSQQISREATDPGYTPIPTVYIFQTWTLGLLYLRLLLRLAMNYPNPNTRAARALRAIVRDGMLHPDVRLASRAVILPALAVTVVLLTAPIGIGRILTTLWRATDESEKLRIYRYSYPALLVAVVITYGFIGTQKKIDGWRTSVRDEVYLVGERLHNFSEPDKRVAKKSPVTGMAKPQANATVDVGPMENIATVEITGGASNIAVDYGSVDNARGTESSAATSNTLE